MRPPPPGKPWKPGGGRRAKGTRRRTAQPAHAADPRREYDRRGAHRSEPEHSGALSTVGHVLESTVPKRVQPPRFLTVMVVSGVTLALTLFGYSTTQIYLRFSEPPSAEGAAPGADATADPGAVPGVGGAATAEPPDPGGPTSVSAVSYQTVETSSDSFTGQVTVTNTGGTALDGWELALGFSEATVTDAWDVDWERTGTGIVARQPDWADPLAPGDSVTVSFTAEGEAQRPDSCSLNDAPCDL